VPVQSDTVLNFLDIKDLTYEARLYELRDQNGTTPSRIAPNWFGVAIPNPKNFDISSDVYVVLYFHPTPNQAGYRDSDYFNPDKNPSAGRDWKDIFAHADRFGGQMAGAIQQHNAPANRLTIFPFLTEAQYTLPTSEWFNVIHDILQDINTNVVPGICTRPKKIIVATLSNGGKYLNRFLTEASGHPNYNDIIEVWDFDSAFSQGPIFVDPHGKRLRAYWQAQVPQSTQNATYIHLPARSWGSFPNPTPSEVPPLPGDPGDVTTRNTGNYYHHLIRDTMFLDADWNIENDNP
jgi:hypothetical protein